MSILQKIKKLIQLLIAPNSTAFKIIDVVKDPKNSRTKIRYQSIGKSLHAMESITKIFNELTTIQGFSKEDSAFIIETAELERGYPDLVIKSVLLNGNGTTLIIMDQRDQTEFEMATNRFHEEINILKLFSPNDIKIIITLYIEQLLAQEGFVRNIKNQKINF